MNLAAEMAKLPEPPSNSKPPLWDAWRHDLWSRAQEDDPRNFMRWPCVYHCMLVDHWPAQMQTEFEYVSRHIDMRTIIESGTKGIYQASAASSALNLTHQAYHLLRWQEATGLRIADQRSIYEFGGGYGAMALVARRMGFTGTYYIYDLPEFTLLQQWYLGECGIDGVEWVGKDAYGDADLLIACYSLSETDFDERDRILKAWQANSYLFLYSNKFEQYDNIEYFCSLEYGEWFATQWRHSKIAHLPPESWYTWGW